MQATPPAIPPFIADIYELAGVLRRYGDEIAHAVGQTQARWQVLSVASDQPKTAPQIARRLGVSRQSVQRIGDVLVNESLARFVGNPDHRTSPYLILTDVGQRTLRALSKAARSYHVVLAARLNGLDLEALQRGIRAVQTAVDGLERTAAPMSAKRRHVAVSP
jgi:DNA-binding MarR family transcriptional regulator